MTSAREEKTGVGAAQTAGESSHAVPNGKAIGVYRVDGVLGQGGMGVVYRATDTKLHRPVAIKFLSTTLGDPQSRRRFQQEAETASSLNHPHIVTVYDVGEHDGSQYIVSELVEGGTLEDWLKSRRPGTWRQSVELLIGVADAIAAAHAAGVLHRDIKPGNILIDGNGYAKLADFGLAKLLAPAPSDSADGVSSAALGTVAGVVIGTVAYMSPEQATGQPLDARSDIFSFGVVLYEALAGRRPFEAKHDLELLKAIVHATPAPLPSDVPELLRNAIERTLEKDPADRYQSMRDLVSELRRLARKGSTTTSTTGVAPTRRERVHLRWSIAAAVVFALAAVAGGSWYLHRRAPSEATAHEAPSAGAGSSAAATQPSIAVLPFVNLSADPEQEYFSDGLSEELINQLGHIEGLQVTARGSAFAFKGRNEDLRAVGKALGVANILEGSVRKSGGRVRVVAQLVDTKNGYNVWTDNYESELGDVFAIQDKIATAVATKLAPTLGVRVRSVDYGGTTSFEAYDHLLRGRALFTKNGGASEPALAEYRRALAIDPSYAQAAAWVALAISASGKVWGGGDEAQRLEQEREEATRRALAAAPMAPLALVSKVWLHGDRREWVQGDETCAAVFAAAGDPDAEGICAGFLSITGRVHAALPYREVARRADPLSMVITSTVVRAYAFLDMGDELAREYARVDDLNGYRWDADEAMLAYLMHHGAPRAEIADRLERACATRFANSPPPKGVTPACVVGANAIRSPENAALVLHELLESLRTPALSPWAESVALWAAYLGDRKLALDALDVLSTAPTSGFQNFWYPLLGDVRKDPRFKDMIRKIGFVDLWRKTGHWGDFCRPLGADDFECF
jgi:serine/threonine protein kinase